MDSSVIDHQPAWPFHREAGSGPGVVCIHKKKAPWVTPPPHWKQVPD